MSTWYYAQGSQQFGPVNEVEIKEMLASGKLTASTLVWKDGLENWTTAGSLPEFQFRPPPLPSHPAEAKTESAPDEPATVAETEAPPLALDPEDVKTNKSFGILAYLWLLFLVPLLVAKDSPFAKYHANQGLSLFLAWLILSIGTMIVGSIPGLEGVTAYLYPVIWTAWLVFAVIGILNAAKGQAKPLPWIGHYNLLG